MLRARLTRTVVWTLAIQMVLQPFLLVLPTGIASAAISFAASVADQMEREDPLTAIISLDEAGSNLSGALSSQQQATDGYGLVYVANESQLGRTRNFYSTSPIWTNIDPNGTIITSSSDRIYDFELDPLDPFNVAWVAANTGLWRTQNLDSSPPTWELVKAGPYHTIEFGPDNRIYTAWLDYVYFLNDNGATWIQSAHGPGTWLDSMAVGPTGDIYIGTIGGDGVGYLAASYDDGATWQRRRNVGNGIRIASIYSPSEKVVYFTTGQLFKAQDNGSVWPNPIPAEEIPPPPESSWGNYGKETLQRSSNPLDNSFIITGFSAQGHAYRLCNDCTSGSLIATGIFHAGPASQPLIEGDGHIGWGTTWPITTWWVTSPALLSSTDGGVTWRDATGNWREPSVFGSWAGAYGGKNVEVASPSASLSDGLNAGAGNDCRVNNNGGTCQVGVGNPINTLTGNHTYAEVDISLPTAAGSLSFRRSYSTFNARDVALDELEAGVLSPGWFHNYEVRLLLPGAEGSQHGLITLQTATGSRVRFRDLDGDGTFSPEIGAGGSLVQQGTVYRYTSTDGQQYVFEDKLTSTPLIIELTEIHDGRGHQLTLEYPDPAGQLYRVVADSQRYLQFGYDTRGRLTRVSDPSNRAVEFGYTDLSTNGPYNLTSVLDLNGRYWYYTYAAAGRAGFTTLDQIEYVKHYLHIRHEATATTSPDPISLPYIVKYVYDPSSIYRGDNGREYVRATQELDGAGQVIIQLTFNADGTTRVESGNVSEDYTYGASRTLRAQGNTAGDASTAYDRRNFRPDLVQDPNGNSTDLAWSADGANLESIQDAQGNTTGLRYDAQHHLIYLTNADLSKTYFIYNTPTIWDPVTDQEISNPYDNPAWDADVLRRRVDNYVDGVFSAAAPDEDLITQYEYTDGTGEQPANLVSRVEAPSGATCYTYNSFAQPTEVIENCVDRIPGPGTEDRLTEYTYDSIGRLAEVADPLSHTTRYTYLDGDDQPDEVTTNYDDTKAPYEDELWNLATRTFRDALGRVVATVTNYSPADLPGSGSPEAMDFDGDGVTDASLEIDPDDPVYNQITLTRYDAAGRVSQTLQNYWPSQPSYYLGQYNFSTRTFYDGAGRVVATVTNYTTADLPGAGTPAAIDFDGDGTTDATLEISPDATEYNQITRTSYDSAGRVSTATRTAWPGQPSYYLDSYNLVTAYEYDAAGNILKTIANYDAAWTDGNGNAYPVSVTLDPGGTPATILVDPDAPDRNVITCTEYDELNRPFLVREACIPGQADYLVAGQNLYNVVSKTFYDTMGRTIATVRHFEDPDGDGTLVLSTTRNFITRTYYDGLGRAEYTVENFVGDVSTPTPPSYDPALPDRNRGTRFLYDSQGRQIATVRNYWDPSGGALTEADIAAGLPDRNLVSRTYYNARGEVTHSAANFVGDIFGETVPAFSAATPDRNLVTAYSYDALGRRVDTTMQRGASGSRTAHTDYDALGRVDAAIANYADGVFDPLITDEDLITRYVYNLVGQTTGVTDPAGRVQASVYDALGRATYSIMDPAGLALTTQMEYDAAGRTLQATDGSGRVTTMRYDGQGRLTETTADPGGLNLTTRSTYDLLGRVVTSTNEAGIVIRYEYDNLGRLIRVYENYAGNNPTCAPTLLDEDVCTRFEYDAAGNRTAVVLGNGSWTEYQYDALGRLMREAVDPGGVNLVTEYRYDAAGNQTRTIRAPGTAAEQITETGYDALGRVVSINYPDATPDVTYSYEPFGPRDTMLDGIGAWSYDYDQANRLTGVAGPLDNSLTYTYDGTGNRTGLTLPGMSVTYTYDPAGRLDTLTDPFAGGSSVVDYGYDGASRVTGVTLPSSVATSYGYDPAGRLENVSNGTAGNPSAFTYTLDPRGNRTDAHEQFALPGPSNVLPVGLWEETDSRLTWSGTWVDWSSPDVHGGTTRYSGLADSAVSFQFDGVGFTLYRVMHPNRGTMEVCIDTNPCQQVTNYSNLTSWAQPITFSAGAAGIHSVTIRHLTPSTYLDIDAIEVLDASAVLPTGSYPESEPRLDYAGAWNTYTGPEPQGGATRYTSQQNATASFLFEGESFALYRLTGPNRGLMEVCIDANPCQQIDNYAASYIWRHPVAFNNLGAGIHGVIIRHLNTTSYLDVDGIEVGGSPVLPEGLHQETDYRLFFNGIWQNFVASGANGGSTRYTNELNATASFTFDGTGFTLYRLLDTTRGLMEVCIDGACQMVDNYSATQQWNQPVTFGGLAAGVHSVTLRNATAGKYLDVDAILVYGPTSALSPGLHQETDPRISYSGTWLNWVATGPNGGSTRYTNELNATASFTFDGTGFTLYRLLDTTRGLMEVCIDGACQTVDNYSATQQWNQPVTFGGLAAGIHSATIRHVTAGKYLDVDAIEVLSGSGGQLAAPRFGKPVVQDETPTETQTPEPTVTPTPTATGTPEPTPTGTQTPTPTPTEVLVEDLPPILQPVPETPPVEPQPDWPDILQPVPEGWGEDLTLAPGPDTALAGEEGMGVASLNPHPAEFRWHYTYDDLGRVNSACAQWNATTSACEGDAWTYTYDGAGNLLRFDKWSEGAITPTRFVYNGANQIQCIDADASGVCDGTEFVYQYDAYGNLFSDGSSTYTYDAALRLSSVTTGEGTTTYQYNGDGDRVAQTVNGVQTAYVIDTATPLTMVLAETTGTDTIRYLHGLDLVAQSDGVSTEYFAYDGLGSVRQVLDSAGTPLLTQSFDPYGNPYARSGADQGSFGYAGEQTDSNGLVFLRARYYNPAQGRFMQMDPSRQERTPYVYANNNPINSTDPSGLIPGDPSSVEGTLIDSMIKVHFLDWADLNGRAADVQVEIPGARKKDLKRWAASHNLIVVLPDPEGTWTKGYADLIDYTARQVYEIKHIPAWPYAWGEAEWYRWHLEIQYDAIRWDLGTDYLAEYGDEGTYIGDWPSYPDYEVWAKLYSGTVDGLPVQGAVVYWEKQKPDEPEWEDLAKFIAIYGLYEALKHMGIRLPTCSPSPAGAPASGPAIYLPYGMLCQIGMYEYCANTRG